MKREDWQAAYEPIPAALHTRVSSTLSQLDKEEKVMKRTIIRTLALALCAALLLCCTAVLLAMRGQLFASAPCSFASRASSDSTTSALRLWMVVVVPVKKPVGSEKATPVWASP